MIKFRRELPDGATLMIAKNTLMRKASENTKFSTISECSKGMNAWLFVDENVAPTFKKFRSLAKDWKKEGVEIDFTGAVLDEKFLSPSELKPLESLPTIFKRSLSALNKFLQKWHAALSKSHQELDMEFVLLQIVKVI